MTTDGTQIVPLIPADGEKSSRRSVFLVKFTDASRASLDQILKSGVSFKSSAPVIGSVEMGENEGSISFGLSSTGSKSDFRFSISDMRTELAKGQLESTRQRGDFNSVESIGQITQRLKILASDKETFESTKQKALQEVEEAKKQSEKISSVKVKPAVTSKSGQQKWQKLKNTSVQRPLTPLPNAGTTPKSSSGGKTVTPPGGGSSSSSSSAAAALSKFGDPAKKSLRQRIIQHLALRPSKPADLLARLTKEGLLDEDKSSFDSYLNDVAQPKAQSNGEMELRPSSWADVRTDWPHYAKYDMEVVKKNVAAKKLTQSNSSAAAPKSSSSSNAATTDLNMFKKDEAMGKSRVVPPPPTSNSNFSNASNYSSSSSSSASYSSPLDSLIPDPEQGRRRSAAKRRNDNSATHAPPAKEAALDSGKCVNSDNTVSAGLEDSKKSNDSSKSVKGLAVNGRSSNGLPTSSEFSVQSHSNLSSAVAKNDTSQQERSPPPPRPPSSTNNNNNNNNNITVNNNNTINSSSNNDGTNFNANDANNIDYYAVFPSIRNKEERRKYKDLFDQEYDQYMEAYNKLHDVTVEFEKLGERLDKLADKESTEYKSIEKEIYIKYKKFIQDPVMVRCKSEHERLRSKLAALKDRVKEFDELI